MVFHFYPRGYVEGKDDYLIYMGRCAVLALSLVTWSFPVMSS
jgi:hypothetical protein